MKNKTETQLFGQKVTVPDDRPRKLRIIGDVHGNIKGRDLYHSHSGRSYENLIAPVPYSIQLGDFNIPQPGRMGGYNLDHVDPANHKIIAGNHENFKMLTKHFLTGFGFCEVAGFNFFYVHGAFSVDHKSRTLGVDLFEEQELSWYELSNLIKTWKIKRPQIVLTHDCPASLVPYVGKSYWAGRGVGPSRTANALQVCFEAWQPTLWFFGHYHKNWTDYIDGTRFFCLDELAYMDFNFDEIKQSWELNHDGPQ